MPDEDPTASSEFPAADPESRRAEPQPHQSALLSWFIEHAPSLADPYQAAIRLMQDRAFPARVHLICHIVRDIYDKLPEILNRGYTRLQPSSLGGAIDAVAKVWPLVTPDVLLTDTSNSTASREQDIVTVPLLVVRKIEYLLEERRKGASQPSGGDVLARALYERYAETHSVPPFHLIRIFEDNRSWFVKRAHLRNAVGNLPPDDELTSRFDSFERTLYSLVSPHFTVQQELDDILQQANQ